MSENFTSRFVASRKAAPDEEAATYIGSDDESTRSTTRRSSRPLPTNGGRHEVLDLDYYLRLVSLDISATANHIRGQQILHLDKYNQNLYKILEQAIEKKKKNADTLAFVRDMVVDAVSAQSERYRMNWTWRQASAWFRYAFDCTNEDALLTWNTAIAHDVMSKRNGYVVAPACYFLQRHAVSPVFKKARVASPVSFPSRPATSASTSPGGRHTVTTPKIPTSSQRPKATGRPAASTAKPPSPCPTAPTKAPSAASSQRYAKSAPAKDAPEPNWRRWTLSDLELMEELVKICEKCTI